MKWTEACLSVGICLATFAASGEDRLPVLKSGDNIYSNVVVTSVTATDVYFSHSGGFGNAKLKTLDPELQKHFHFNPAKAGAEEKKQTEAAAQFRRNVLTEKEQEKLRIKPPTHDNGDLVLPNIFARSFRGERPPPIVVEKWITEAAPKVDGKFVLLFFWATSEPTCLKAVPHINELGEKYKDKMIIIGLSNEPEEEMKKWNPPPLKFYVGTDTQSRSLSSFEVTKIPHAVLIDPNGFVRFEGIPSFLTEKDVDHLLDTYGH
jgi:thiol-disulfide isomerase/thioredoxin